MQQSAISKKMTDPEKLRPFLYPISPRMFPSGTSCANFHQQKLSLCLPN